MISGHLNELTSSKKNIPHNEGNFTGYNITKSQMKTTWICLLAYHIHSLTIEIEEMSYLKD